MADLNDKLNELNNTPDTTAEYDQNDIEQNKVMAILAYLGILVLVPLFAAKESKFARFHTNQGLVLAIAEIVVSIAVNILDGIPLVGIIVSIAGGLIGLVSFILAIIGIINAAQGKAKELPVIGGIKLLK